MCEIILKYENNLKFHTFFGVVHGLLNILSNPWVVMVEGKRGFDRAHEIQTRTKFENLHKIYLGIHRRICLENSIKIEAFYQEKLP